LRIAYVDAIALQGVEERAQRAIGLASVGALAQEGQRVDAALFEAVMDGIADLRGRSFAHELPNFAAKRKTAAEGKDYEREAAGEESSPSRVGPQRPAR
jgi:hypothetical protein